MNRWYLSFRPRQNRLPTHDSLQTARFQAHVNGPERETVQIPVGFIL